MKAHETREISEPSVNESNSFEREEYWTVYGDQSVPSPVVFGTKEEAFTHADERWPSQRNGNMSVVHSIVVWERGN